VLTDTQINEARFAAGRAVTVQGRKASAIRQSHEGKRPRKFGRESNIRAQRRANGGITHDQFIQRLVALGGLGRAMDDPAYARHVLRMAGGEAPGYAASGFPQAAGGVDVSAALTSVRPGIRKIKKLLKSQAIVTGETEVTMELPKSGYLERPIIRIEGTIQIKQGATAQAITVNDIRTLVQRIRFEMSSSVVPKNISGLVCDIIDNLDVAVVNANNNVVPTGGELSGIANSTTEVPFVLELSPRLTVSDQNLYGIPYLGAISTTPRLVLQLNPLLGEPGFAPFHAAAAGPTAALVNTKIVLDGWRIDLPAPVAPSATTDAEGHMTEIPGEGLWAESSYLLKTNLVGVKDQVTAGLQEQFRIPIGPMYTRLILLAYVGQVLDTEVAAGATGILEKSELGVQQVTTIESRFPWQFDSDYRNSYYKTRPKGVYVHSGIDQSGTDEDLWVTQDLGDFILTATATARANGAAGTRFELYGQGLMPISAPGLYA
jgi:hypothetical protein